jgi:hypothetical protein
LGLSLSNFRRRGRRRLTPTVEECRADADYSLWLVFDDGLEGRVYLGDLVSNRDFSAWRDIERFLSVSVDPETGVVQWEDGIALDSGALYRDLASRVRAALQ